MTRSPVRLTRSPRLAPLVAGLLVLGPGAGCGGGGTGPDDTEPGPAAVIFLTPLSPALKWIGQTVQLNARPRDARGRDTSLEVVWTSSDPDVVQVDGAGLVTARGGGTATVTVAGGSVSAQATVTVTGETDATFLRATWSGEAVYHRPDGGTTTLPVVAQGRSETGGSSTFVRVVAGEGSDALDLSLLAGSRPGTVGWMIGVADARRGTYVVTEGSFGLGRALFDSGTRLGEGRVERLRMERFREDAFDLGIEVSGDGGGSWSPVWTMTLQRTGSMALPAPVASAACADASYRGFDFWLGNWDVTQGGSPSGRNLVEPVTSGCGVRENWTDAGGSTGISLNMRDARSGLWTQLYMASTGGILEIVGGREGSAMVLGGPRTGGGSVVDRITWSPLTGGDVRQHWQSNTGNSGWVTVFDGLYRLRGG